MKEIQLSRGLVSLIDDQDHDLVRQYSWYASKDGNTWYARTNISIEPQKRRTLRMHILILNPPHGFVCDHVDGNGLNNCRSNLRIATQSQNIANSRLTQNKTSKYRGVYWHKRDRRWCSKIRFHGKDFHIGHFDSEIDAAMAYDKGAIKFFGEFAKTNFPLVGQLQ